MPLLAKVLRPAGGAVAVAHWRRSPAAAAEALGTAYQGTGHAGAIQVLAEIAGTKLRLLPDAARSLLAIGGDAARQHASELIARYVTERRYDHESDELRYALAVRCDTGTLLRHLVESGLSSQIAADVILAEREPAGPVTEPYQLISEVLELDGCMISIDPEAGEVPPDYAYLLGRFIEASGDAVVVENIEFDDDEEEPRLRFTHQGETHEFEFEDFGDYYDGLEVLNLAGALTGPPGDDRGFEPLRSDGSLDYVFAERAALRRFAERTGVNLTDSV